MLADYPDFVGGANVTGIGGRARPGIHLLPRRFYDSLLLSWGGTDVEEIGKLLDHLGYATPLLYGAAAYRLFAWLDEKASEPAKTALASTMKLKGARSKEVAAALVEIFDRVYTYPVLHWRAAFRSLVFTVIMTVIFVFEMYNSATLEFIGSRDGLYARIFAATFLTNAATDYFSLFALRPWLVRLGNKPVFALLSGVLLAVIVVYLGSMARAAISAELFPFSGTIPMQDLRDFNSGLIPAEPIIRRGFLHRMALQDFTVVAALPALAVFIWLPLFALGILVVRAVTPLSWIVAKAQWALKEGDEHPLKAIGFVVAPIVFAITLGLQLILKT